MLDPVGDRQGSDRGALGKRHLHDLVRLGRRAGERGAVPAGAASWGVLHDSRGYDERRRRRRDTVTGRVASVEAEIDASRSAVWRALTDPDQIEKYMFGSRVETDWTPGSRITWKGVHGGKQYEDKGEILEVVEDRRLKVTHFSPLSGKEDAPENYHTLVYELDEHDGKTRLSLSQDNNPTEEAAEHSRANWQKMLTALKDLVEEHSDRGAPPS
jgi:uncharacterized protein YndB with AHSA1/START domain